MKLSSKMLQNLPYFLDMKTLICSLFRFAFRVTLIFFYKRCPGSSTVVNPKLFEMKNEKKTYFGFLIPKIWPILKHFARQFYQA